MASSSSSSLSSDAVSDFLRPLIAAKRPYSHRPFVTLTYAQSLDGKIAGKGGKQIQLSGKESREVTHKSAPQRPASSPRVSEGSELERNQGLPCSHWAIVQDANAS